MLASLPAPQTSGANMASPFAAPSFQTSQMEEARPSTADLQMFAPVERTPTRPRPSSSPSGPRRSSGGAAGSSPPSAGNKSLHEHAAGDFGVLRGPGSVCLQPLVFGRCLLGRLLGLLSAATKLCMSTQHAGITSYLPRVVEFWLLCHLQWCSRRFASAASSSGLAS